jgi:Asp-tRNA(Asn)/Glu-tRNA(Gln) amidotransferase A subunit family amidase
LAAIDNRELRPRVAQLHGLFTENANADALTAIAEFRQSCTAAESPCGIDTRDVIPPESFNGILRDHLTVMSVQTAQVHQDRFRRRPEEYPPRIAELIQEGLRYNATEYFAVTERQTLLIVETDHMLRRGPIWLTAAATGAAPGDGSTGRPVLNSPWSYTRVPTVSLPVSRTSEGLPLAIQLIAGQLQEDRLLAAAACCEEIAQFDRRLPPVPG